MEKDYYTVEQVSELLNIHPKTIQRYIREGKLPAAKLGKSWRINGHDLSVYIESNKSSSEQPKGERSVTVSCVVDISVYGSEDARRIMNLLTSAHTVKPVEYSSTSMQSQYIEREKIVRVMLWGDIRFMTGVVEMIGALTEQKPEKLPN
ncbi:MAG: helix-turn-helix domain-containing protein [Suipraeoptans sp.]